jgi:alanine racemase
MTMIDVTGVECEIGDVVTLIGRERAESLGGEPDSRSPIPDSHSSDRDLSLERVAWDAEMMSPYELLTGLRTRLTRIYLPEES